MNWQEMHAQKDICLVQLKSNPLTLERRKWVCAGNLKLHLMIHYLREQVVELTTTSILRTNYVRIDLGTWKVAVCLHVSLSVACVAGVKEEGEGGIWASESARGRKERNACKEAIVSLQVFLSFLPRRAPN